MYKNLAISLVILSFFTSTFCGDIQILLPPKLDEWWKAHSEETKSSIAAFGVVPWGKKVMGTLVLAEPATACDYIRVPKLPKTPIMVVVRGDCPFYVKAHYAQLAGARMLIVVDNQYENVESKLMVDSAGQGEAIRIPSILLAKKAGDKLLESLKTQDKAVNNVQIVYDFSIPKNDVVNYNLWLSSGNLQSFRFMRAWKEYQTLLDKTASMEIHFSHFSTTLGSAIDPNYENCICGGKYCAADPDGDLPNNGADVIQEDLRQLCLLRNYEKEVWWYYLYAYEDSCIYGGDMKQCSERILRDIGVDPQEVQACVKNSFDVYDLKQCKQNYMLDEEKGIMTREGVFIVPSATINGFQYRGNIMPAQGVFDAICESFNKLPDVCVGRMDTAFENTQFDSSKKHTPIVASALIFLAIFSFFVFCCYRRYLKREMYKQMVRDVNIAVSQYIAFKDQDDTEDNRANE